MENIPPLYLPSKNAKNAAIGDVYVADAILALLYGVIDKLYASFNLSLTNFVVCNSFVVLDIILYFDKIGLVFYTPERCLGTILVFLKVNTRRI